MARDDYHVIAYRILAYLYACLKSGEKADLNYLKAEEEPFKVARTYWDYIMRHLYQEGYIEGVMLVRISGSNVDGIKLTQDVMITPVGIEFLQDNSKMNKAKAFLKTLKETVPGL